MKTAFKNLFSAFIFASLFGLCFASQAVTLTVDKASAGWTGSITFRTNEDVNLGTTPIIFDLSNGVKVSGIWGINGKPEFTQAGSTVSVKVTQWWPEGQGYTVKANTPTTISFGTNSADYAISNVRLGGQVVTEGSIVLIKAQGSSDIPSGATVKLVSQADKSKVYTFNYSEGANLKIPYGKYDVSASAVVNAETVSLGVSPTSVDINSAAQVNIAVSYTNIIKNITFAFTQANPESFSGLNVTIKDLNNGSSSAVNIPWDVTGKQISITQGHTYEFTASDVTTSNYVYSFSFSPSSITAGSASNYSVNISYSREIIPAGNVFVEVNGLPEGESTELTFTPADSLNHSVIISDVKNGKNALPYELNIGDYTLSAAALSAGSYLYSAPGQSIKIVNGNNDFSIAFTGTAQSALIKGWPSFIAMGGVTRGDYSDDSTFAGRPLDSIFKYAGDGGNGDPGRIVYPVATTNTMTQAEKLTAQFGRKVMPVMVVYTGEMSGGTSFKDFDDSANVLTMHFINLMLESEVMQSYKSQTNSYPGSMVLNPDLFGMVQQQNLWNAGGTGALNKLSIGVNTSIQKANWFVTTKHDWNLTLNSGTKITVLQKTPAEFITLVRNGTFKDQGVYTAWDIKAQWEAASEAILAKAPSNLNASLPSFESNFKGWIQATNWAVKTFGPDVTFGWQSNVWSVGSALWVHNDLSAQQITNNYAAPVADLWNALGVYNGAYRPDFVVFDKYERDAASETGSGYLWNQRDINNYMSFVKSISDKLGNFPVMLWQIPGGHMQLVSGDVDTRENHASTEPNYFFGDAKLLPDLSNVKSYFMNIALPTGIYGTTSMRTYLTQNGQDWTKSHMNVAKDSRVFSILWGGGDTTSIGKVGADDNGWLAGKVIEYYKNPTYLGEQTPVELNAVNDTASTYMNQPVNISVLSNDQGNGLEIVGVSSPVKGSAVISGSQITYTPISGFTGTDSFTYTVKDSSGEQAAATVAVSVNSIPAPVINADTAGTTSGQAVTIDVLANDIGSGLTITEVSAPSAGSAVISNGKIIYTPAAGFSGTASFSYTAKDSVGQTASANVSVVVTSAPSNSADVSFTVTSDWGSGFNADLVITNNTASAFSSWVLEFDFPHEISSLWNGEISSHTGIHYVVKNSSWNGTIPVSGTASIGFGAAPGGNITEPYNVTLNGVPVSNGGGITPPPPEEDKTAPSLSFSSLYDGQIISLKYLSPVSIAITAQDEGGIAYSSISVEGTTYDGVNALWTPSAFGAYKIVAFAKDSSGNSTTININIQVVEDTNPQPSGAKKQIIGYITQWDAWKGAEYQLPAKGIFNQLNVDYSKYTILNYSFFGVAKDGSLHSADFRNKNTAADQEPAPLLYEDIYSSWDMWLLYGDVRINWETQKAEKIPGGAPGLFDLCKDNNVKLMASIGGWSMSKHFSAMAADSLKKANFLRDCKKLIDMGFDGIDIDWEYPGPFEGMNFWGTQSDFQNFADLMRDIRGAIGYDKLLTAAFSAAPAKLEGFNFAQLDLYMDYFNMMTYDMEGGWSNNAGHNSPLYNSNGMSWDQTFKYLTQQKGVKPEKINLGAGFYGRGVKTVGTAALGAQTSKSTQSFSVDGSLSSAADFVNWGIFEGCPNYAYLKNNTSDWTRIWDNNAKVPYLIKGNYFLSYDDAESIKLKADYIVLNNAGGVIVWQVFGDMEFSGGVTYSAANKLPKAGVVKTELLDALHNNMNK